MNYLSPTEAQPLPMAGLAGQVSFTFYWAHRYPVPPDWVLPPPEIRPYATLWLVTEGELNVTPTQSTHSCGPGTLVVWPPEHCRTAHNASGQPALIYTAAFNLRLWGELDFFRLYQVPPVYPVPEVNLLAEPFSALVAELAPPRQGVSLVAEGWARVLVGRWLECLKATGDLQPRPGVDERLDDLLAAIEADLAGDWSLQRLAQRVCLSKVRMRELFVRGVGLPPGRYVTLRRLSRARQLLLETDLTCAEIAARCGFHDPGYFSRMFHRVVGLQPLAYREQGRFRSESTPAGKPEG